MILTPFAISTISFEIRLVIFGVYHEIYGNNFILFFLYLINDKKLTKATVNNYNNYKRVILYISAVIATDPDALHSVIV